MGSFGIGRFGLLFLIFFFNTFSTLEKYLFSILGSQRE